MERGGENAVGAQFTYDHTGLRVKKSVNGVDTLYLLNGKNITHIRKGINGAGGTDAIRMHFFYDAQGSVATAGYNGVDYAYQHNLQGDVVGLMDMDGNVVVEYGYDAWERLSPLKEAWRLRLAGTTHSGTGGMGGMKKLVLFSETQLFYLVWG